MLKNVTLSAEETLISQARKSALQEHTTLNAMFRQWLTRYVRQQQAAADYEALMQNVSYAQAGRNYRRDEMNER